MSDNIEIIVQNNIDEIQIESIVEETNVLINSIVTNEEIHINPTEQIINVQIAIEEQTPEVTVNVHESVIMEQIKPESLTIIRDENNNITSITFPTKPTINIERNLNNDIVRCYNDQYSWDINRSNGIINEIIVSEI